MTDPVEAAEGIVGAEDVWQRREALGIGGVMQALMGCEWGRAKVSDTELLATADDREPCPERAVCMVVVHDGQSVRRIKVCDHHRLRVLAETTPHVD